jgi:hypothetical protein
MKVNLQVSESCEIAESSRVGIVIHIVFVRWKEVEVSFGVRK